MNAKPLKLRDAVRTCRNALLEKDALHAQALISCLEKAHPKLVAAESRRLMIEAVWRMATSDMKTQRAQQGVLAGLDLPLAIAVRREGAIAYVRWNKATWDDLIAGADEREQNLLEAKAQLDRYLAALRRLRPFMIDTGLTVAEALALEKEAGRSAVGA